MKPSNLPKDRKDTLRVSTWAKETLAAQGISLQALLDKAIDESLGQVQISVGPKPTKKIKE